MHHFTMLLLVDFRLCGAIDDSELGAPPVTENMRMFLLGRCPGHCVHVRTMTLLGVSQEQLSSNVFQSVRYTPINGLITG
jgi:hypothetical protein